MIKSLQKRFVIMAMTAVSLLLVLLLGIINIANALYSSHESDKLLNILSNEESIPHHRAPSDNRERRFFSPPPTEDTRISAVYFTVYEKEGEFELNLNRITSVTEEDALALAEQAAVNSSEYGKIGSFKYKTAYSPISSKKTYVFLDITSQRYAVLRVVALSCLAGLVVWILMLLFVVLLSRRAILPIAKNIEKQKQFVTDAGHEIKTPLAIILANTEAMELHGGESKWSNNIKAQVSRLDGLMKDLLTLARSDEANTNLPKSEFNLSELISGCSDMFCESAALRGVMIEHKIPDSIRLISNKDYITRIISALLDNAVKYAKPDSVITIVLLQTEKSTEIKIKNDCEALPSCAPEKLFDRFYREDSARTQKSGGYGIGLSAVQAMAELLGGNVFAKYEGPNSIVFTVKL